MEQIVWFPQILNKRRLSYNYSRFTCEYIHRYVHIHIHVWVCTLRILILRRTTWFLIKHSNSGDKLFGSVSISKRLVNMRTNVSFNTKVYFFVVSLYESDKTLQSTSARMHIYISEPQHWWPSNGDGNASIKRNQQ